VKIRGIREIVPSIISVLFTHIGNRKPVSNIEAKKKIKVVIKKGKA
jgi:hypothetical protein